MTLKDIKRNGCHFDMIPLSEENDKIQQTSSDLLNITLLLCNTSANLQPVKKQVLSLFKEKYIYNTILYTSQIIITAVSYKYIYIYKFYICFIWKTKGQNKFFYQTEHFLYQNIFGLSQRKWPWKRNQNLCFSALRTKHKFKSWHLAALKASTALLAIHM